MSYEQEQLQLILEGALLAAGEPLTVSRMLTLFEDNEMPTEEELSTALESVAESCHGRGFSLVEVASGYRFQVREDLATWVNRLWEEKPQKYSRALLETLALIAYRQPITRGDIEEVRGVAVSSHIIKTLVEREWVKVVGHRDVPGRPALYATTRQFLDYFNLKSLDELPTLGELRDIDSLNETLEFDNLPPEVQESVMAAAATASAAEASDSSDISEGPITAEESEKETDLDAIHGTGEDTRIVVPVEAEEQSSGELDNAAEDDFEAPEEFDEPSDGSDTDRNSELPEASEDEADYDRQNEEPDPDKLEEDSLFHTSDGSEQDRGNS
ncbi:segregation and condensation protein B [Alteromonadaceae bacterium 2753L.S.0a.02]|nr:segregation and condensation protein B [Alteromonadaceae bacterium 2753L.S.0a.02]